MLFPFHCQAGKVQHKVHKLTSNDNCTEVLLPTQAFEACSYHLEHSSCDSHSSQPEPTSPQHLE